MQRLYILYNPTCFIDLHSEVSASLPGSKAVHDYSQRHRRSSCSYSSRYEETRLFGACGITATADRQGLCLDRIC